MRSSMQRAFGGWSGVVFVWALCAGVGCDARPRQTPGHLPLASLWPSALWIGGTGSSEGALASTQRGARQFIPNECTQSLTVMTFNVQSGCQVDQRITQAPGLLRYRCAGGPATATFGASTFTGGFRGGTVNLTLRTAFTFTDGCQWQTLQRIFGSLLSRQLSYSYLEAPLPGQQRCARPCGASAMVLVQ